MGVPEAPERALTGSQRPKLPRVDQDVMPIWATQSTSCEIFDKDYNWALTSLLI